MTTLGSSSQDSVTQLNGNNIISSSTTEEPTEEKSSFGHFERNKTDNDLQLVQVVANGNNKNGKECFFIFVYIFFEQKKIQLNCFKNSF